jgi:hypothetical protein
VNVEPLVAAMTSSSSPATWRWPLLTPPGMTAPPSRRVGLVSAAVELIVALRRGWMLTVDSEAFEHVLVESTPSPGAVGTATQPSASIGGAGR